MNADFHHWSYRVVCHDKPDPDFPVQMTFEKWYAIHEVHFADDGSVTAWTAEPVGLHGADVGAIRSDLILMRKALDQEPIIASEVEAQWAAKREVQG